MGHFTDGIKKIVSPTLFKKKIREGTPKNCPCRLCKTYVQNIGLLQVTCTYIFSSVS